MCQYEIEHFLKPVSCSSLRLLPFLNRHSPVSKAFSPFLVLRKIKCETTYGADGRLYTKCCCFCNDMGSNGIIRQNAMGWVLVAWQVLCFKDRPRYYRHHKMVKRADLELSLERGQKRISEVVTTPSTDETCRKQLGVTLVPFRQISISYQST